MAMVGGPRAHTPCEAQPPKPDDPSRPPVHGRLPFLHVGHRPPTQWRSSGGLGDPEGPSHRLAGRKGAVTEVGDGG